MPEEAIVLRREEGIDDLGRDLLPLERDAPLLADLRDQLAVARVHLQWQLHRHVAQFRGHRHFGLEELECAREA